MSQSNPPGDRDAKMPDPAVAGQTMADIAQRSRRLVTEWLKNLPRDEHEADPAKIGSAFLEMTARLMANPGQLLQAQVGLWQAYMSLWQNTTRRLMGYETTPVIDTPSGDRRFKDGAWKDNEVFDFIKQEGPSYGLHLNDSKCKSYWPTRRTLTAQEQITVEMVPEDKGLKFL